MSTQQAKPVPKPAPDAAATPAAAPPAPIPAERAWKDRTAFLISHGWRFEGEPDSPAAQWFDPAAPERDVQEFVQTGEYKHPTGRVEKVKQLHVTPRAFPVGTAEAVSIQLARMKGDK